MAIEINDKWLDQSPQGRFLLGVATGVEAIDHPDVERIVLDGVPSKVAGEKPTVVLIPLSEESVEDQLMGLHCVRFRCRVVEVQQDEKHSVNSTGWRLAYRDKIERRFAGMQESGSRINYGGDCFTNLRVDYGPLYDDASRAEGFVRSELIVSGEYQAQ